MKKILLLLGVGFLTSMTYAQGGLERIIVEKYYVSNADDSVASAGVLPPGSVTYRLFVDMKPGYYFQSCYGEPKPKHDLIFKTTTRFFNNEDRGAKEPSYTFDNAKENTTMLDTWVSCGAVCDGYVGVLKSKDDGVNTIVNSDNVLKNKDPFAGIPLTVQDGMVKAPATFEVPSVTFVGLKNFETLINNSNILTSNGQELLVDNGAWAALITHGAVGLDTNNIVLIGQFTTDGVFSYELNIQLGDEQFETENYVANKIGSELTDSTLKGTFNPPVIKKTDIASVENKNSVEVSPNPVSDVVSIKTSPSGSGNKVSYQLIDILGNVVVTKQLESSVETLNMKKFASGIYILQVIDGNNVSTVKILKK